MVSVLLKLIVVYFCHASVYSSFTVETAEHCTAMKAIGESLSDSRLGDSELTCSVESYAFTCDTINCIGMGHEQGHMRQLKLIAVGCSSTLGIRMICRGDFNCDHVFTESDDLILESKGSTLHLFVILEQLSHGVQLQVHIGCPAISGSPSLPLLIPHSCIIHDNCLTF